MILVAGGTGTLGTRIVRAIDAPVRVLTREAGRARHLRGAEIVVGDVRAPATLTAAVRDVTTIVWAVQGMAGTDPGGFAAVDLGGLRNLLDAADAQRLVLLSTAEASPASPLELRRVKYQAETMARNSALATTIIRPTAFLETWLGIFTQMAESKRSVFVFGRGENPVNFVSVSDVAALVVHAVRSPELDGKTLQIGGPDTLPLTELARAVLVRQGLPEKIKHVPLPVLRVVATALRPVKPMAAALVRLAIAMDTTDMTLAVDTARAAVPGLPVTRVTDVLTQRPNER
ncbi:NAD(P)H-binding protein [Actinocrispum sp. NPDC049592]|uniref:SDR family oxidoreductase n=1 Tax=Actinocrispum sp. NPDC049592 TaxID=3154835 RepID=UPI00343D792E